MPHALLKREADVTSVPSPRMEPSAESQLGSVLTPLCHYCQVGPERAIHAQRGCDVVRRLEAFLQVESNASQPEGLHPLGRGTCCYRNWKPMAVHSPLGLSIPSMSWAHRPKGKPVLKQDEPARQPEDEEIPRGQEYSQQVAGKSKMQPRVEAVEKVREDSLHESP